MVLRLNAFSSQGFTRQLRNIIDLPVELIQGTIRDLINHIASSKQFIFLNCIVSHIRSLADGQLSISFPSCR